MIDIAPVQKVGFQIRFRNLGGILALKRHQHAQRPGVGLDRALALAGERERVDRQSEFMRVLLKKMKGMRATKHVMRPVRRTNRDECG